MRKIRALGELRTFKFYNLLCLINTFYEVFITDFVVEEVSNLHGKHEK